MQALQHELIARYEIVVVTDVDELITPCPKPGPSASTWIALMRNWSTAWAMSCCTLRERAFS
jgi:hypothetical protein